MVKTLLAWRNSGQANGAGPQKMRLEVTPFPYGKVAFRYGCNLCNRKMVVRTCSKGRNTTQGSCLSGILS